jgi:hypothetical protein
MPTAGGHRQKGKTHRFERSLQVVNQSVTIAMAQYLPKFAAFPVHFQLAGTTRDAKPRKRKVKGLVTMKKNHRTTASFFKSALLLTSLTAFGLGTSGALAASTPEPLGTFKDWKAFSMDEGGRKVCFIVSTPKDKSPKNVRRGDVFFLVTDWGDLGLQPSVITGYPYKKNSKANIKIGSDKFNLFTKDDGAWFRDESDEKRVITAMKRGSTMVITGTSARGTLTTDRYSLSGITAALDKINRTCN